MLPGQPSEIAAQATRQGQQTNITQLEQATVSEPCDTS